MTNSKARSIWYGILIAVLALPAGYIVLSVVQYVADWLWFSVPTTLGTGALWAFVLLVPAVAGALVVWLRKVGNPGHNPLSGISMAPVTAKDYPSILGAIAITLFGGLVLGPEAAIVCTGAVIGTVIGSRVGMDLKHSVGIGSIAAILALFVHPIQHGTFTVASGYQFRGSDLIGALVVGIVTSFVILVGRWLAIGVLKLHRGDSPRYLVTVGAGLLVGLLAMGYHVTTGNNVALVMTSGESNVKSLLALGSVGMILATVALKWLAYSLSMGSGFRGGPFFPAIFVGAGIGGAAGIAAPDIAQGAVVAGIAAAVVYLAHPSWLVTGILAVALGLIGGGPLVIPLTIVAVVVAKLIPALKYEAAPESSKTGIGAGDQDRTGTTSLEG